MAIEALACTEQLEPGIDLPLIIGVRIREVDKRFRGASDVAKELFFVETCGDIIRPRSVCFGEVNVL